MSNLTPQPAQTPEDFNALYARVQALLQAARQRTVVAVQTLQAETYFEIGRQILEHEQAGKERATYGKQTLKLLAERLTREFGRGFSKSNLEYMRRFYLEYRERTEIAQMPSGQFRLSCSQAEFQAQLMASEERSGPLPEAKAAEGDPI